MPLRRGVRGIRGVRGGMLRSTRAAVGLHPFGFGVPVAVIAAAVAYLIVAGPVSIRLGHPGTSARHPQTLGQSPSSTDPPVAARPGPTGQASAPGPGQGRPVTGYVGPGKKTAMTGTGTGTATGAGTGTGARSPQPGTRSTRPAAPASPSSPASPGPASSPPAPAPPGSNSSCLDLDVLTVCV